MQLTLYNFSKRHNSTALPSSGGNVVDVVLKRETSLNNPVFILQGDLPAYNYAAFNGAYYFIDDIISVRNDVYEIACTLDVLATIRSDIFATSAFVEYATSGNTQIPDTRLNIEYGVAGVRSATGGSPLPYMDVDINDIARFITVIGQSSTETYFISEQALLAVFDNIAQWAQGTIDTTSLETIITTGLQQLIGSGSAADCIRDAYCLPIVAPLSVLASASPLRLGLFNTGLQVNRVVGAGNVTDTETISIPHQYADWRKQSPYEVCQLFLPLYGTINIPSDIAADSTSLTVKGTLNVRSGNFTYYVSGNGRGDKEIVVGGNCAAPLAVGASNINMMQAVNSGGTLATAFMGNVGAINSALNMIVPSPAPYSTGQAGGISNRSPRLECYVYYRNVSDGPAAGAGVQGIPLFATKTLSTLSGYVQTKGASVGGNHRDTLREQANALLDSGVFLE